MVWNKGLKTGLIPKTAFKKGHKHSEGWIKAFNEGKIGFKKGHKAWHKGLSGKGLPGYKTGRQKTAQGYIQIVIKDHPFADKRGRVFEHRYIMELSLGRYLEKNERIDHINGIRDDNRSENLRLATHSQNQMNRGKPSNNTTGYKNIYLDKIQNKYYIQVGFDGKTYCVKGSFIKLDEAIEVRNKVLKKLHGEFAKLD